MSVIHPTAVIDPQAELGEDVEIGPHCYVGPKVVLGDGCRLLHNVSLYGKTVIGRNNEFYPGCVIGTPPQDLKYKGGETDLFIGEDNVFREHVTVHPGTEVGGYVTRIGNHNLMCVGVHIGHDVHLGNDCVITNFVQVAGHILIEDRCHIGGMTGIQSFVTVGRHAYVAAMSRVRLDVPPYMIVQGYDMEVRGVNVKGIRNRWGFSDEHVDSLWAAYRILFGRKGGCPLAERIAILESKGPHDEHVTYLLESVKRSFRHGIYGRYLESLRQDSPADLQAFYQQAVRREPEGR